MAHLEQATRLGLPSTHAYHLRRQRYLELQGESAAAVQESQLAEATEPTSALDYFLTGDSYFKQKNINEAALNFARAVGKDPGHFWAWYFFGICNLQLQRPELAKAAFIACEDKKADFLWLYLMRGFANGQLNQFEDAESDFDRAESMMKPLDLQARYGILVHRGSLCLRQAKFGKGKTNEPYREAKLAAAHKYLDQARELQKEHYTAYFYLAQVRQEQQKLEEAVQWINLAIEKDQDQNRVVQSHLHGQRARLHRQRQMWEAALEDIDAALRHFATAEDHVERARILYALKRPTEAVAACDEALKLLPRKRSLRPEEVEIYRAKAEALLATRSEGEVPDEDTQRREREALLALQQYVKQQGPPAAEVFRTMGMLHSRRRQIPEAINAFQQALELQLDSATFTARGWAYLASEDDRAMADFAEAIRLDEKNQNAGAYAGRGLIHARQGRPAEASADAKRALKLSGENPRFLLLWNVAHVYAQNAAGAAAKGLRRDFFDNRDLALDVLEAAFRNALPEQRRKLWAEYIAQDGLLAALRDSDRFARLENAYHQKTPKSANK